MSRGKAKRTLRDLTTIRVVDIDHILPFEEVEGASDRAAAILCGAHLEAALRVTILSHLPNSKGKVRGRLCDQNGALSSFYPMISLAEAMGIISPEIAKDLEMIRHIRNAFAHSHYLIDFSNDLVATECNKLVFPSTVKTRSLISIGLEAVADKLVDYPAERVLFCGSCMLIAEKLQRAALKKFKNRDAAKRRRDAATRPVQTNLSFDTPPT